MPISADIKISDQVVCFPIRKISLPDGNERRILTLSRKNRVCFIDKLTGYGGKVEWIEELIPKKCRELLEKAKKQPDRMGMRILNQAKELSEEGGIKPFLNNIFKVGEVWIVWPDKLVFLSIFTTNFWEGEFVETEEMGPPEEFDVENPLPYEEMIEGDELWFPKVLEGRYFHAIMEKDSQGQVTFFEFTKPSRWWL